MSKTGFFTEISEKRSQLLQIVIGAVVIAVAIGLLINMIYDKFLQPLVLQLNLHAALFIALVLMLLVFTVIALFADMHLGRTVTISVPMILLINRTSGDALPITYQPATIAGLILTNYVKKVGKALFNEEVPGLTNSLLRDLIEVILADWLTKVSMSNLTPDGRVIKPPISFPQTSKKYITIKPLDILKIFGENSFLKLLSQSTSALSAASARIPKNFDIIGYRHEERGLLVDFKVDDKVLFKGRVGGTPGGSELIIKGSRFNPLKYFVVRTFIDRTSYGDALFLELSGYTPVVRGKDRIECREKIFEGEELEEIRKWVEIDYNVIIAYKLRGWLFFHPRFLEVARWAEAMANYADYYFNFSKIWEVLKRYRMSNRR